MRNFKLSFCALALMAVTAVPAIAESVNLSVKGTIIPAACTPAIIGEIDYGYITVAEMDKTGFTVLDRKEVGFTIMCTAPVKVSIRAINKRPNSVAGVVESGPNNTGVSPVELFGIPSLGVAGLGADGGANVGGYAVGLMVDSLVADTEKMFIKYGTDGGAGVVWAPLNPSAPFAPLYWELVGKDVEKVFSWADAAGLTAPVAITNLSGTLAVQAYLNKKSELDLSKAIQLNGMTTIELVYL